MRGGERSHRLGLIAEARTRPTIAIASILPPRFESTSLPNRSAQCSDHPILLRIPCGSECSISLVAADAAMSSPGRTGPWTSPMGPKFAFLKAVNALFRRRRRLTDGCRSWSLRSIDPDVRTWSIPTALGSERLTRPTLARVHSAGRHRRRLNQRQSTVTGMIGWILHSTGGPRGGGGGGGGPRYEKER